MIIIPSARGFLGSKNIDYSMFGLLKGTLLGSGASVTNPSVALGSVDVLVGDLIFALFAEQTNLTVSGAVDNLGNTYAPQNAGSDGGVPTGRVFWSRVTNPGALTQINFAATASADDYNIMVAVIGGPFAVACVDANPANSTSSNATTTCPATGTLAQAKEVVMAWYVPSGGTPAATAPNVLAGIEFGTRNVIAALGYQAVNSTASVAPVFTNTGGFGSAQGTMSFKQFP